MISSQKIEAEMVSDKDGIYISRAEPMIKFVTLRSGIGSMEKSIHSALVLQVFLERKLLRLLITVAHGV